MNTWDPELGNVDPVIDRALQEDVHAGDVTTTATVAVGARAEAAIIAKAPVVACGVGVAMRVFMRVDPSLRVDIRARDGVAVAVGDTLLSVRGSARSILVAERTALNFLQRLCAIATSTRMYVDAAAGRCRIADTRKTTPGLRAFERYAIRCGGGHNHRNDLGSGVLIKENHIRCAGGVTAAVEAARARAPHTMRVACEVTNQGELESALRAGADTVLLDNMDDDQVAAAIAIVQAHAAGGRRALVEVSGGITLERIPKLAALGVDVVSVGALTHSVAAADLSLLVGAIGGESAMAGT